MAFLFLKFQLVLTNWLLNLFYSNIEMNNEHPKMCTQDILQFNTIMCPILFAQMCGHVLYIDELKRSPCTLTNWYQHIEEH
jgi:hypothetical protein